MHLAAPSVARVRVPKSTTMLKVRTMWHEVTQCSARFAKDGDDGASSNYVRRSGARFHPLVNLFASLLEHNNHTKKVDLSGCFIVCVRRAGFLRSHRGWEGC